MKIFFIGGNKEYFLSLKNPDKALPNDWIEIKKYLLDGSNFLFTSWAGIRCKICDELYPHILTSDGIWIWSCHELVHYVEEHGICLQASFLEHIRKNKYIQPALNDGDCSSLLERFQLYIETGDTETTGIYLAF